MFNRKDVLIVTAGGLPNDGSRMYGDMAETNIKYLKKYGYDYILEDFSNVNRKAWFGKPYVLLKAIKARTHKWVVWMDTDSIMVRPIDEVFENNNFDVGLLIKERDRWDKGISRASHHGNFLYAHFIPLKTGLEAIWFLEAWNKANENAGRKDGDLLGIHKILDPLMKLDETVFNRAGDIETTNKFKLKFFNPYIYGSMAGIIEHEKYKDNIKIIHFKGKYLKKEWLRYKKNFL